MPKNISETKIEEKLTDETYPTEQPINQAAQTVMPSGNTEEMVKALTLMFQKLGNQTSAQTAESATAGNPSRKKKIDALPLLAYSTPHLAVLLLCIAFFSSGFLM